ncbi:MAG: Transcriptional regulator, PadR family, partial [uncultured Corynebacteriales bacterium]
GGPRPTGILRRAEYCRRHANKAPAGAVVPRPHGAGPRAAARLRSAEGRGGDLGRGGEAPRGHPVRRAGPARIRGVGRARRGGGRGLAAASLLPTHSRRCAAARGRGDASSQPGRGRTEPLARRRGAAPGDGNRVM